MREGILVNVDNVAATPHIGNRSDRGLSLRDPDRALARIHEEQRRLILLIGLEGASYEAAARIIDVPIGTACSRVSRGRATIRKLMDRRDEMEAASGAAFMNAVPKRRSLVLEDEPTQNSFRVPMYPSEPSRSPTGSAAMPAAARLARAAVTAIVDRASTPRRARLGARSPRLVPPRRG